MEKANESTESKNMKQAASLTALSMCLSASLAACNRCPTHDGHQFEFAKLVETSVESVSHDPLQITCPAGFDFYILADPYALTHKWLEPLDVDADSAEAIVNFNMAPEHPMIAAVADGCVVSMRSLGPAFDVEGPSLVLRARDVIEIRKTDAQRPFAIRQVR